MLPDIKCCNSDTLRDYLMSSASLEALGAGAETQLQRSEDYLHAKEHIIDNQRNIAFWDGIRSYTSLAAGIMTGMLGGAIMSAANGNSSFSDAFRLC